MGAFTGLMSRLDAPLVVVTTGSPERSGCLVGFSTQTSVHPERFLACISEKNHTFHAVRAADVVVVHLLGRAQRDLAELFGGETGDDVDKFERCAWSPGPEGVPVLADCVGWFGGRVLERLPLGDHLGLLVEPFGGEDRGGDPDLGFQSGKDIDPGHPV